jgi:hypothetical protein
MALLGLIQDAELETKQREISDRPREKKNMSTELIILIVVLVLLFGGVAAIFGADADDKDFVRAFTAVLVGSFALWTLRPNTRPNCFSVSGLSRPGGLVEKVRSRFLALCFSFLSSGSQTVLLEEFLKPMKLSRSRLAKSLSMLRRRIPYQASGSSGSFGAL